MPHNRQGVPTLREKPWLIVAGSFISPGSLCDLKQAEIALSGEMP
jgi:hypothetical protein